MKTYVGEKEKQLKNGQRQYLGTAAAVNLGQAVLCSTAWFVVVGGQLALEALRLRQMMQSHLHPWASLPQPPGF